MIGVINPNSTQTLDAQMLAAARADFQIAPGEAVPKEGSGLPHDADERPAKLSTGAIVGIAVGCVAFLVICALLLWYVLRHEPHNGESMTKVSTAPADQAPTSTFWDPAHRERRATQAYEVQCSPVELPGSTNKY